jgi:hypothetical protein
MRSILLRGLRCKFVVQIGYVGCNFEYNFIILVECYCWTTFASAEKLLKQDYQRFGFISPLHIYSRYTLDDANYVCRL